MIAHVIEVQIGNDRRCVARHRLANRIDEHHLPSPPADTSLGKAAEVIREDGFQMDPALQPFLAASMIGNDRSTCSCVGIRRVRFFSAHP